jgi:hypothetical protein
MTIGEVLGVGVPLGVTLVGFGGWVHSRVSVVEAKHEALKETVERIESKVDDLPKAVAAAVVQARK